MYGSDPPTWTTCTKLDRASSKLLALLEMDLTRYGKECSTGSLIIAHKLQLLYYDLRQLAIQHTHCDLSIPKRVAVFILYYYNMRRQPLHVGESETGSDPRPDQSTFTGRKVKRAEICSGQIRRTDNIIKSGMRGARSTDFSRINIPPVGPTLRSSFSWAS
jgi:hypothetical protein